MLVKKELRDQQILLLSEADQSQEVLFRITSNSRHTPNLNSNPPIGEFSICFTNNKANQKEISEANTLVDIVNEHYKDKDFFLWNYSCCPRTNFEDFLSIVSIRSELKIPILNINDYYFKYMESRNLYAKINQAGNLFRHRMTMVKKINKIPQD